MMDMSAFEASLRLHYGAARVAVPIGTAMTLLHIGAEQTGVATGTGLAPQALLTLTIGSQKTARDFFRHTPANPLELENAIVTVEDEVTRARALIPAESKLYSTDLRLHEIALRSGINKGAPMQLSLDAMERTFDRLTSVALGRPTGHEGIPADNTFAATLLILREFMHHLQFSQITILEPSNRPAGTIT
jgi:exopolyphosphatase/pppGpp-phosphohydrolase